MNDNLGMEEIRTVEEGGPLGTPSTEKIAEKPAKLPMRSQYHGYPKEWERSMAGHNTRMEMEQVTQQANFHRIALKEVRKALGKSCTHLTHVIEGGMLKFRAKLIIKNKLTVVNVDTEASEGSGLRAEDYKNLKDVLANAIRS